MFGVSSAACSAVRARDMEGIPRELLHMRELNAYLEGRAIPGSCVSIDPEAEGRRLPRRFPGIARAGYGLGSRSLGCVITVIQKAIGFDVAVLDVHASEQG